MAKARAAAAAVTEPELPIVEERHFRSDNAFLCLLLNRRTKQIRVIDFRAGALPAKRLFIQSVAQREGVEKEQRPQGRTADKAGLCDQGIQGDRP